MIRLLVVDSLHFSFAEKTGQKQPWLDYAFEAFYDVECHVRCGNEQDLGDRALEYDGVVIAGSAEQSERYAVSQERLAEIIAKCRIYRIPFLGIDYGAQLLASYLGATKRNPEKEGNLGQIRIEKTDTGHQHFLFDGIPGNKFMSIASSQPRIAQLPDECQILATDKTGTPQAFACNDMLLGVNFHPELGDDSLEEMRGLDLVKRVESPGLAVAERCDRRMEIMQNFVENILMRLEGAGYMALS